MRASERASKQEATMQSRPPDPVENIRLAHGSGATWLQLDSDGAHRPGTPEVLSAHVLARPLWILAICALVVGLRQTREVLIPLLLAILFSLILSGIVEALRRRRVPRGVSALILLLACGFALGSAVNALSAPAQEWVQNAPRVLRVIEHRVRPARAVVSRLGDLAARASALAGGGVELHAAPASSGNGAVTAVDVLAETGWVLAGIVTVTALTLLLLSAGPGTLARMTAALGGNLHAVQVLHTIDAIRVALGRYYGTLALINLSLGAATSVALWLLHMPNPMLWGALAAILNFIPYLGSAVTLLIVSVVALVSFDSIPHVLLVSGTYLGLATIEGQIVEPIFFGHRLHLNPIVVFVALWLGGWLWGIAGVLFALPVLLATKVAASQNGASGGLARFLGPARGASLDRKEQARVEIRTVLGAHAIRRVEDSRLP
jgi:predicted PurR-regulated permease PerM